MEPTATPPAITKANPNMSWKPRLTGWYHLVLGATLDGVASAWDGASLAITQLGRTLPSLSAVTSSSDGHVLVHLIGGQSVQFAATSTGDNTSIKVVAALEPQWPRTH